MLAIDKVSFSYPSKLRLRRRHEPVAVLHEVDLTIEPGEIVALVGESGCGKSTLARTIVGLHRPSTGAITFDGVDVHALRGAAQRAHRRDIQMIFQDPFSSLGDRSTIASIVGEGITIHHLDPPGGKRARVRELLAMVSLDPATEARSPTELSGGQAQRVSIARALAVEPRMLVCDEPVTALDVSVQARILNLLMDLRDGLGLGCLFITHDLAVVAQLADRIAVMHQGRIVETGPAARVLAAPEAAKTIELLASVAGSGIHRTTRTREHP